MCVMVGAKSRGGQFLFDTEVVDIRQNNGRIAGVTLASGQTVDALVYVVDTDHVQYVGGMPLEEQAQIISTAVGGRGPNTEYLWNTVSHLAELGIEDDDLGWLDRRVRELAKQR